MVKTKISIASKENMNRIVFARLIINKDNFLNTQPFEILIVFFFRGNFIKKYGFACKKIVSYLQFSSLYWLKEILF